MKLIKYFVMVFAIMVSSVTNAQELKKKVLGVEDFTYSSDFSKDDVEMVRNQIVKAIQKTGRVIVTDRNNSTSRALNNESERRKQESAMDANTVSDMSSLNADCILSVNLDKLTSGQKVYEETDYRKNSSGKSERYVKGRYPYYVANVVYTVKIINCENGAVMAQETYNLEDGHYSLYDHSSKYSSQAAARDGLLSNCVNQDAFTILILNTFKAEGKILKVEEGNAKKAKTVYVSLGSEDGIQKKQMLEVYKEMDIDGELSRKLIGELEVEEVLGKSRSLAKVKKGGEEIQQALSNNISLPVSSRNVKQSFWGGVK